MNALAFQSAYRQITQPERSFVDRLVDELHHGSRVHQRSIRLALDQPLPQSVLDRDERGWLDRPLVIAAIHEQILQRAHEDEISPKSWIKEVHTIAHASVNDFYDTDELGDPVVDMEKVLSSEYAGAIKAIEFEKSDNLTRSSKTKVKITMHDKVAALKMEAAYMGLDDGENPHRRADRSAQQQALQVGTTAEQAGERYGALIGD